MPTRYPEPSGRPAAPPASSAEPRIVVLRWPEQDDVRTQLAALGVPRILVIAADADPPDVADALEDWVREPLSPGDLQARERTLWNRRAERPTPLPHIDGDGILRVGRRWVVLPDQQLPVVALLLEQANQVVSTEAVAAAYRAGGGSDTTASIRALVSRLAQRLRDVGLRLHTVPRRGLILELPVDATGPSAGEMLAEDGITPG